MSKEIKISSLQLGFLIIGMIFGDFAIMNPARNAMQDSWLAFLLGMLLGGVYITIYIIIAKLNPSKTLIEILIESFGGYLGKLIGVLYIWYFIHIAALVLRSFGAYAVTVNYNVTPQFFIIVSVALLIVYGLRKGLEVMGRVAEIVVPILIASVLLATMFLINRFNYGYFQPMLENGWAPVIKTAFGISTFPFGEMVVLLMIFPYLNQKSKLVKTTYLATVVASIILLIIVVRDLLVLGPTILTKVVFPPNTTTSLLPSYIAEPLISANLLIGGGLVITIFMYASINAIKQVFNLDQHKPLIIPIATVVIGLSIWIYDSLSEMFRVAKEIYPYYSLVYQLIIPLIILLISIKNNTKRKGVKSSKITH